MTDDEKSQLLDRYVSGEAVSPAEEAQIDHLFRTDSDFQDEYRVRQALFEAGKQQRREAWEEMLQQPLQPQPRSFPMRWVAAASLLLLLGAGLLWWVRSPPAVVPLAGQAPLYEQRDTQLGLAGADSAVGTIAWEVRAGQADAYQFEQADSLIIYSKDRQQWQTAPLRLTRLSETRYRLHNGSQTYLLEQGRSLRLPLQPE